MLIWIVIVLIGVAGAGMLAWGARGRRVNDHPICRGCGFDLVGLYPGITMCPECGRDIGAIGGVQTGARRARWWMAVAGAVALVIGLGVGAIGVSGVDTTRYKPVWWIVNIDLRRGDVASLEGAAAELRRRFEGGEVSGADLRPAADRILAIQGREDGAWSPMLGDLFETLWASGGLGDERTLRYMRQSLVVSLQVEEAYEAGMVRFRTGLHRHRHGSATIGRSIPLCVTLDGATLTTPGGVVEIGRGPHGMIFAETYPRSWSTADWKLPAPRVPNGTYPLEATVRLRYDLGIPMETDAGYISHFQTTRPPEQGEGAAEEWTVTLTNDAEVLEEDREVYRLVVDPDLRQGVRDAFSTPRLRTFGTDAEGRTHVQVQFTVFGSPAGLEHRVILRQGSREVALGERVYWWSREEPRTRRDPDYHHIAVTMRLEPHVPLELVLRPAPKHRTWWHEYKRTQEAAAVWGEDIVLPVEAVRTEGAVGGG